MGLRTSLRKRLAKIKYPLKTYKPNKKKIPENIIQVSSAWIGLEQIIEDILDRFDIKRDKCIEFGTEYCYSTVVFSNYFKKVKGVDIFIGDVHSGRKVDHFSETLSSVSKFKNIELIKSDYKDYIKKDDEYYDFAHVDIIHAYKETYECGLWAVNHSKCCIFHDTESFPEVRKAVYDIAKHTGKKVYNYPYHHGLGIIV
jgi:hypothetical protein